MDFRARTHARLTMWCDYYRSQHRIHIVQLKILIFLGRFLSVTSKNQITFQHWMKSTRIIRITSGFVTFGIAYCITSIICNALFKWNIFPIYTICLMDSDVDNFNNSMVLTFFVMPTVLMAYTAPILDFVSFRLIKLWANQSKHVPEGNEFYYSLLY